MRARQLRWLPVGVSLLLACVHVDTNTRVERGPLLRTFHKSAVVEGGAKAVVTAEWPKLSVTLEGFDTCRDLTVEEYAEEHVTERTSPAAGPAFSTGVTNLLASAVLFGASFIVSTRPDVGSIDAAGHYGPSQQQVVRAWSIGTVAVGLPALAVGVASMLRVGEESRSTKVEQVVGEKDARCNERPLSGPVELKGEDGAVVGSTVAKDGPAELLAAAVSAEPEALSFFGRTLELEEPSFKVFDAFAGCVAWERASAKEPKEVKELSDAALTVRAERLHRCRGLRKDALEAELNAADDELRARREAAEPGAFRPGAEVSSFDEAMTVYAPKVRLEAGSKELFQLSAPRPLSGKPVLLRGLYAREVEGVGLFQIGDVDVFVRLPTPRRWVAELSGGTRLELVALGADTHTAGERTLPLFNVVWGRAAY